MEENKVMAFRDEDGNKIEFEVVAKIFLKGVRKTSILWLTLNSLSIANRPH